MLRVIESRLRHGADLRPPSALRLIAQSQSTTPGRTGAARSFALMRAHFPYAPAAPELTLPARRAARRSAGTPPKHFVDPLLVALCGAGFGITLGLALAALLLLSLTASGILHTIQSLAACAGTYLVLVEFLLISRAPFIERAIGQDSPHRRPQAHRPLGPVAHRRPHRPRRPCLCLGEQLDQRRMGIHPVGSVALPRARRHGLLPRPRPHLVEADPGPPRAPEVVDDPPLRIPRDRPRLRPSDLLRRPLPLRIRTDLVGRPLLRGRTRSPHLAHHRPDPFLDRPRLPRRGRRP